VALPVNLYQDEDPPLFNVPGEGFVLLGAEAVEELVAAHGDDIGYWTIQPERLLKTKP
jgi:hypothetical protein